MFPAGSAQWCQHSSDWVLRVAAAADQQALLVLPQQPLLLRLQPLLLQVSPPLVLVLVLLLLLPQAPQLVLLLV